MSSGDCRRTRLPPLWGSCFGKGEGWGAVSFRRWDFVTWFGQVVVRVVCERSWGFRGLRLLAGDREVASSNPGSGVNFLPAAW